MSRGVLFFCIALGAAPLPCRAALPDEIQVYVDDLNDAGQLGLQLHLNTTPSGIATPSYPGESVSDHGVRLTPEFAYGLGSDLEAGLYLPVVHDKVPTTRLAGVKLRLKWVPLRPREGDSGFFAGLNGELSQVQQRYDDSHRSLELRPMLGWHDARWLLAVNPVLGIDLAGPGRSEPPSFEPSYKVSRRIAEGIATGIEYYTAVPHTSLAGVLSPAEQTLFWAIDVERKPWVVNFGIGRGLTADTDRWTVKLIIDVPVD